MYTFLDEYTNMGQHFSKCSMMSAGHHSDSSITTYSLTENQNIFTIQFNAGSKRNISIIIPDYKL